jgi:hypothetical protein
LASIFSHQPKSQSYKFTDFIISQKRNHIHKHERNMQVCVKERLIVIIFSPGEELGNGVRGQDGRAVTISNTLDLRLKILIGNHRDIRLESVAVRLPIEPEPPEVLGVCVPTQYLRQNPLLHSVYVPCHLLDELKRLCVILACRRAKRVRDLGFNRHC